MRAQHQQLLVILLVTSVEWGRSALFLYSGPSPFTATNLAATKEAAEATERRSCFYRSPSTRQWTPRIELAELTVGQKLEGAVVVQEKLDGRTGPKLWVDCGVGRFKRDDDWNIQTAMLRLGGPNMKGSVASKKAARLRKKKHFPVYVSRIRLDNDQMEVTTLEEELVTAGEKQPTVSVSSLKIGQELSGIIQRVEDYGIFVNVGANRPGLLHIRRVGDLYQKFIHKSAGLKKVGLTKGVQVNVQVISCDQKRLFLDFSDSLKQEAELKYSKVAAQQEEDTNAQVDPYAEEAALFVAQQQQNAESTTSLVDDYDEEDYDEDDDEEDDDYDEDRDIEDAMGLGRY